MTLTLAMMRDMVREGLGELTPEQYDNVRVDRLLNLSFWSLEKRYKFRERECIRQASLQPGVHLYNLPGDIDSIKSVALQQVGGDSWDLTRMSRDQYEVVFRSQERERGKPSHYYRVEKKIDLWPTPSSFYSGSGWKVKVFMLRNLQSLLENSVSTTGLPRDWDELVVDGAIWRGHKQRQEYDSALAGLNLQTTLIRTAVETEAKDNEDSQFAGLDPGEYIRSTQDHTYSRYRRRTP